MFCSRKRQRNGLENFSAGLEAALLIEEHYDEICDELWYIYTTEENRRARLKASRGYSDAHVDRILPAS